MQDGLDPEIDPADLARAEAALANLSGRYLAWAEADLARLERCMAEIEAGPADMAEALGRLFQIAHDMKGQGATFDYPRVTDLGNRLCRLTETASHPNSAEISAMADLVAGLGRVIRERLSGEAREA